jgi:hypothetical protein
VLRVVGDELLEGGGLRAPLEVVAGRDRAALEGAVGAALPGHHEAFGVREVEGPEQQRVDATEDRRVRADAERHGEDGDGREARILPQHARREAEVLPESQHGNLQRVEGSRRKAEGGRKAFR